MDKKTKTKEIRFDTTETKRKHRYTIVKPVRFFTFVFICIMAVTFTVYGIFGAGRVDAAAETKYTEVKIQDNDTLWNIIETYNPHADIDIRMALYDVYEINDITADSIMPGDVILVPIYD